MHGKTFCQSCSFCSMKCTRRIAFQSCGQPRSRRRRSLLNLLLCWCCFLCLVLDRVRSLAWSFLRCFRERSRCSRQRRVSQSKASLLVRLQFRKLLGWFSLRRREGSGLVRLHEGNGLATTAFGLQKTSIPHQRRCPHGQQRQSSSS